MRDRKCPWCGLTNTTDGTDCGQFFAKVCDRCGKGFIYAKPKREAEYSALVTRLHQDKAITELMYASYENE